MGIISAIMAVLKIITFFEKWFPALLRLFRKDPIEQIKEAEKAHDDAAKKAELDDNTGGSFSG